MISHTNNASYHFLHKTFRLCLDCFVTVFVSITELDINIVFGCVSVFVSTTKNEIKFIQGVFKVPKLITPCF